MRRVYCAVMLIALLAGCSSNISQPISAEYQWGKYAVVPEDAQLVFSHGCVIKDGFILQNDYGDEPLAIFRMEEEGRFNIYGNYIIQKKKIKIPENAEILYNNNYKVGKDGYATSEAESITSILVIKNLDKITVYANRHT